MKKKTVLFFCAMALFLFAGGLEALAQSIKGRVTDTSNQPLVGVSVFFKGTTTGVATDADGNYTISGSSKSNTLVFSCLGMKEKEVEVRGKSVINVALEEDTNYLTETVVIGYAEVQRKDIMGAVASADSKAVTSTPSTSFAEALSGRMAGVSVVSAEGDPDATVEIKVRGTGSITQDASPLYIVDGFPVANINDIAAQDIKSVDVLKDAFSTAIYGSRGAYGVVLITTKDGGRNKLSISYDGYFGIKKMANANALQTMSPYEFAKYSYELALIAASGTSGGNVTSSYEPYFGSYEDMDMFEGFEGNNYVKKLFGNTGVTQNHNVTLNARTKTGWWSASYSHMDEKAILLQSNYKRDNFTFKGTSNPTKKLSFSINARYSNTDIQGAGANAMNDKGTTTNGRLINSLRYAPIPMDYNKEVADADIYNEDFGANPYRDILDSDDQRNRENWNVSGNGIWTIIPNLKFKAEFGMDSGTSSQYRFYGLSSYYTRNNSNPLNYPNIANNTSSTKTYRSTNTLSYNFAEVIKNNKHKVDALLGHEYIYKSEYTESVVAGGFPKFYDAAMARQFRGSASVSSVSNKYAADDVILSFFARANYVYDNRYSFSAAIRADGSSKFADGNRWGIFPSFAASWNIANEEFMKNVGFVNQLKLRYSFGTAGNNRIPSGQILRTFSASQDSANRIHESLYNLVKPKDTMVNQNLKWETSLSHNLGIDFAFFKTRLSGSIELYHNTTKDLLIKYDTPGVGYTSQYRNLGSVLNKGLEISLRGIIVEKRNFGLSVSANIALNANKVLSLGGREKIETEARWTSATGVGIDYIVQEGRPLGEIYGFVSDGWYTPDDFTYQVVAPDAIKWTLKEGIPWSSTITNSQYLGPGSPKIKDVYEDGVIDVNDKVCLGSALPVGTGGFNINMNLYGFDFNAAFSYAFGNVIYNANRIALTNKGNYNMKNLLSEVAPGSAYTRVDWTTGKIITDIDQLNEVNKNAKYASPASYEYLSDQYIEDGSFLRLNSLTLGYTIPQRITQRIHMNRLRIYFTASNLFCLTKYSGYDPEVNCRRSTPLTPGIDFSAYPKTTGYTIGINVSFN